MGTLKKYDYNLYKMQEHFKIESIKLSKAFNLT